MEDVNEFLKRIKQSIGSANEALLENAVIESASYVFQRKSPKRIFSQDVLHTILRNLSHDNFLQMKGSHHLLNLLMYDWGMLNDMQLQSLRSPLEQAFPKFEDDVSSFIIVELFGEYYCDIESLQALQRLLEDTRGPLRQLIPHGIQKIAQLSDDVHVKNDAVTALVKLSSDPDDAVRNEAQVALQNADKGTSLYLKCSDVPLFASDVNRSLPDAN